MKALTTFRRLIARCCFWPFDVLIVSRRDLASASRSRILQQLADRLRAHAALEVHAEAVRRPEAVLELAEDLLVVDDHLRLELAEQRPGLLEPAHRVDRGLLRVLLARLDVLVGLADLDRPLDDRVEVLLRDLPVGAQAEVVRELAQLVRARTRVGLLEHLTEEPLAEVARLLELLDVDVRDQLLVLLVHLALRVEQGVEDAVDVLGDRALLRARRLAELLVERRERLADLDRDVRDRLQAPSGRGGGRHGSPSCGRARGSSSSPPVVIWLATSTNIFPTSSRTSSSVGTPCSSAQFERPRAQKSSSSSKLRSLPLVKYSGGRFSRSSSAARFSSRST
jgi:hypothetical protein